MSGNETILSGKEQAKLNKRKAFYNKFERLISTLSSEPDQETLIPIMFHKQAVIPEYDDMALILDNHSELIKDIAEDSKSQPIDLPDIDEGYFLQTMSKKGIIEIFREEVFVNEDGTIRKGSTGSIDDYNYQSAHNYYIKILKKDELLKELEKEKEEPTTYDIPVKTKKIEKKRYVKTYRYPRRRKR